MSRQKPAVEDKTPRSRWKPFALAVIAAAAAVVLARTEWIGVVSIRNGELRFTRYPLVEERWDHPRLRLLRRRERLDEVIAPGRTQFEKIVMLRRWARSQWKDSVSPFYYPPWDALEILDLAREHGNYGFCSQWAVVFLQACLSVGLHARYVDLGHFITAVWSDDHGRWVIMDPANDIHYERDGAPMAGHELSDASWSGKTAGICQVGSDGKRSPATAQGIESFRNYSVVLRNNQLSEPEQVRDNGRMRRLALESDHRRYPLVGRDDIGWVDDFIAWKKDGVPKDWNPEWRHTDDPQDLRDVVNQTIIMVAGKDAKRGLIKLRLFSDNAPEFETFVASLDGGEYQRSSTEALLELRPGVHSFRARVKTKAGWLGPEAAVELFFKPRWPPRRFDIMGTR